MLGADGGVVIAAGSCQLVIAEILFFILYVTVSDLIIGVLTLFLRLTLVSNFHTLGVSLTTASFSLYFREFIF